MAAELVRRLAAEPIRQGVIRMLPPTSVMAKAAGTLFVNFIPDKLPPREVENVKFKAPPDRATLIPRTHYLPTRREKYGEWQMRHRILLDSLSA